MLTEKRSVTAMSRLDISFDPTKIGKMCSTIEEVGTRVTVSTFTAHLTLRPMKIDIMFLVPARMGFTAARFHYSLFLKNRLNKTPN
jgi:hypothetical protein